LIGCDTLRDQPGRRCEGDAAGTDPKLNRKDDRTWRDKIEGNVDQWWETADRQAMTTPIRSTDADLHELSQRLPDDAIVTADSAARRTGTPALRFRVTCGLLSGTLATMGPGVPYAIGAKWAHPTAGDRARG